MSFTKIAFKSKLALACFNFASPSINNSQIQYLKYMAKQLFQFIRQRKTDCFAKLATHVASVDSQVSVSTNHGPVLLAAYY